ncbi:hypothetical protein B7P43_G06757 [Cryptotermes secundus]|uniref:Odorant receptor n=1 Tax=Cryptotermes secundus TaxID=105785 RepID=A0A2J7RIA7_9NEOP|nr:hypothetical protein B7P43_G06757 [Cryptotermes secundus]
MQFRAQQQEMDSKEEKMTLDEVDPSKILSLNLGILKIGGVWWRDIRGTPLKLFFYRCYEMYVILLHLSFNITVYLHAILAEENVAEFSESLLVCVCQVLHGTKVIPVVLRRKKMTSLTVDLENNFYIHGKNLNNEEKYIIKKAMHLANTITWLYFGSLCTATCVMILTPPTLALTSGQVNSTTQHGYNLLIWKAWLPIDPTIYPYNILAYFSQVALTFQEGCFIIGGLNAFYLVLIIYTTSQFELLSSSLRNATRNIGHQTEENSVINKASPGAVVAKATHETNTKHTLLERGTIDEAICFTRDDEIQVSTYIKECIQYHQYLLQYADDLNTILSPLMFMELLTASLIMCMLGFQLILSEELHNAAYESGWYNMSPDVKRQVQMIIMRAQKPVALRTGQFGLLSMPLFAEVMLLK